MGPVRSIGLTAALTAMLASGSLFAQVPTLQEQQNQLQSANAASKAAQLRSQQLEAQAASERDQAAQARQQEAAAAERIKSAEADIQAARARIAIVDRQLNDQRTIVAARQGPIMRLIAALQSMARRPAALGLVQPGSTEDMVHVRAVLGTVMPVVQARTADVRAELNRIRGLRAQAESAVASFRDGRARLENERVSLVRLEAEHRLNARNLDKGALAESDKAMALGEQARDLVDQMQTSTQAAALQADLQALPGPLPRPAETGDAARPAARGGAPYKLPVAGQIVTGLGELSTSGARARGITLAPAPNADAMAPASGKILYASGFRDYGGIVIIDHGNGWTTAITGLAGVAVRKGDAVRQGQLIGRVGADNPRLTIELRRRGRPMDLTQLLD